MSLSASVIKRIQQEASNGRPPIKYLIQTIDEPLIDEAASFMVKHFLPNESICVALDWAANAAAVKEIRRIWKECLSEGISLAAFLESDDGGPGPIISCNVLNLHKSDPSKMSFETEKLRLLVRIVQDVSSMVDVRKEFNCTNFVRSFGLAVDPKYGGRGIGTEMLRARGEICRLTHTPVSATFFSAIGSQKAASKCGFKTLAELDLTTHQIDGKTVFSNAKLPICKWMAMKYM